MLLPEGEMGNTFGEQQRRTRSAEPPRVVEITDEEDDNSECDHIEIKENVQSVNDVRDNSKNARHPLAITFPSSSTTTTTTAAAAVEQGDEENEMENDSDAVVLENELERMDLD